MVISNEAEPIHLESKDEGSQPAEERDIPDVFKAKEKVYYSIGQVDAIIVEVLPNNKAIIETIKGERKTVNTAFLEKRGDSTFDFFVNLFADFGDPGK